MREPTRTTALAAAAVLLIGALITVGASPASAATAPRSNQSYYVNNDAGKMYTLGCNQGQRDVSLGHSSMVILAFGGQNGSGSTKLIDGTVIPYSQMQVLAAYFAAGYYNCASSSVHTTLDLGTNNSYVVSSSMGSNWANAVIGAKNLINSNGNGSRVSVYGANDFEPGFAGVGGNSAARSWMGGYDGFSGRLSMENFGAASGCPTSGTGGCLNGWTQNDMYYLSWGASSAFALPEIYNNTAALQWKNITITQGSITFTGTLSQGLACVQLGQPTTCSGTNQGPDSSWAQLNAATGQSPAYSCNIGYSSLS